MPILEDIGITINVTDMPEHKEYVNYYLGRNWLVRLFLGVFRNSKVEELRHDVQVALLNEVLERGHEVITWSVDNARHTEP